MECLGYTVREASAAPWMRRVALLTWAAMSCGCGMTLRSDIYDPDPAAKIPAIVAAGEHPTAEQLSAMVEALDHDDAAVRLFAIESLEHATGQTLGYRPYDPPQERRLGMGRWKDWLKDQGDGPGEEQSDGGVR